ncbi:3-phosphoshikimate 1-carboxyvinyltransferase [wastewater metagenome]|uniref:3-phosphoshikimate 1-carboxyvinyltransferase n=2 Tax=unclassified sequences TaxID=12908 RepID=A0A5B8RA42_9ZZZZ|nr:3-phosphoshikimate 1-carboxyvinyltransferase [Arhodomonas aquaeolei]QEA06069.1 3-phosphoshikimate 1-carboxyvinyltransferase [uncultured organism]
MTHAQSRLTFTASGGERLRGRLRVPGDKSISHRAVMFGALAEGETVIDGLLEGEDVLATLAAFRAMGVAAEGPDSGALRLAGAGLHGLGAPAAALDMGNSGTAMRLLCGLLAGQAFDTTLTGDASLTRRPMRRVTAPLAEMGALIETAEGGTAPLTVRGGRRLHGIDYALPVASAQIKSALLLAGLYAEGETRISEPAPCRDHTERMLAGFGYPVRREAGTVTLAGGGRLTATPVSVPADVSSAAFFLVAASITPGSDLILEHVGMNPTRTGVIEILRLMGADITAVREDVVGGEPVADLRVRHAPLHGIDVPARLVPLAIDEFPVLFVAAAAASGETRVTGAEELRVKESDRIAVMAEGLAALGADVTATPDGMIVRGGRGLTGGRVHAHGDHRVAMSFAVASLMARDAVVIDDCANVATSYPTFAAEARAVGLMLAEQWHTPEAT